MNTKKYKKILIRPIVTEKTIQLANLQNKYSFEVTPEAGKIEIAKAVTNKFAVTVEQVRTQNGLGKFVTWGRSRIPGKRSNYKKAIVKLKKGDKIAIFDIK